MAWGGYEMTDIISCRRSPDTFGLPLRFAPPPAIRRDKNLVTPVVPERRHWNRKRATKPFSGPDEIILKPMSVYQPRTSAGRA